MTSNLDKQLERLWGCVVSDLQIDLKNHSVDLVIENRSETRASEWFSIELQGVISIAYDTDSYFSDRAYTLEPWAYIELTSVAATAVQRNNRDVWRLEAELWQSKLLVVANSISVTELARAPAL